MCVHSVSGVGMQSRSPGYCNSQRARLVYRSTALRICKEAMDPEGLRLRNPGLTRLCQNPTPGKDDEDICPNCILWRILTWHAASTDWTCQTIRRMKICRESSRLQWRRLLVLGKSRPAAGEASDQVTVIWEWGREKERGRFLRFGGTHTAKAGPGQNHCHCL